MGVTPFLLVSRSVEYEARLRGLLGARLNVVSGEGLSVPPEDVIDGITATPRIAFLGPVLNFEETRGYVDSLTSRHPDIGLIVVREQRSDLEDWVDELSLHAVLSPSASDDTTMALVQRLSEWLIDNQRASALDFVAPSDPFGADRAIAELLGVDLAPSATTSDVEEEVEVEAVVVEAIEAVAPPLEPDETWTFPPLEAGAPTEAIAVVAPKGGQGKTTLAVNLATGLAEVAPNSVVLVDADIQFGDISIALGLEPERTIIDAVSEVAEDEIVFKTALTHHEDGFFVVAGVPSPEQGDEISDHALGRLINRLRGSFRYVVVDTTPGLGEHTLAAIEHVTDAVFVSNMNVPSLRAMRTEFELLTTLGLMPGNRHLVLNQSDKMSGLTARDAERIIGAPIDVEVPRSSAVLLASNRGVPLIHDDVRDPAAKAIRSLVMRISPEAYPKRRKIQRRRRSNESE